MAKKEDPTTIAELRHVIEHFGKKPEEHPDAGLLAGYWIHHLGVPVIVVKSLCNKLFPAAGDAINMWDFRGEDEARWELLQRLNEPQPSRTSWLTYLDSLELVRRIDTDTRQQLLDEFDALTKPEQIPSVRRIGALRRHHINTTWGEEDEVRRG